MADNSSFLPEGYEIPVTNNYMKLVEGVNRLRVLSKPAVGMEYWKTNPENPSKRTPIRYRMDAPAPKISDLEINPKSGQIDMPQHFWAMVVYNYADKKIQILELKQKGILKALKMWIDNPKWGDLRNYDITITKEGQGMETKYVADHDPKEEMDKAIVKEYESMGIKLEALFDGADPFEASAKEAEAVFAE